MGAPGFICEGPTGTFNAIRLSCLVRVPAHWALYALVAALGRCEIAWRTRHARPFEHDVTSLTSACPNADDEYLAVFARLASVTSVIERQVLAVFERCQDDADLRRPRGSRENAFPRQLEHEIAQTLENEDSIGAVLGNVEYHVGGRLQMLY